MSVTAARTGYSATLQFSDGSSPAAYASVAEATKISGFGVERSVHDATNLTSPDEWKEFIYGIKTLKAFTLEFNYLPTNTTQKTLLDWSTYTNLTGRNWRLVIPDFGAVTKTATVSTTTWTSSSHGFLTGQPIRFTTSGTIPTGITVGKVYWINRLSSSTFSIHLTPEAAVAGSGAVSASGGSGTHTANGTSLFTFTGEASAFTADPEPDAILKGQVTFAVNGAITLTP